MEYEAILWPSWGGNTDFADMRAAYDALDARTKAEIEDLVCEHSLIHSRHAIGFSDLSPEEMAAFRPVRQRLVRTHPVTGRKSDRKSTRLNSSHPSISYAVFCLKKKKKHQCTAGCSKKQKKKNNKRK